MLNKLKTILLGFFTPTVGSVEVPAGFSFVDVNRKFMLERGLIPSLRSPVQECVPAPTEAEIQTANWQAVSDQIYGWR